MYRTLVFRSLHAEQAVEILRGFCTSVELAGPAPLPEGLGANGGCCDIGFEMNAIASYGCCVTNTRGLGAGVMEQTRLAEIGEFCNDEREGEKQND